MVLTGGIICWKEIKNNSTTTKEIENADKRGFKNKDYAGSITRLDVDCIVNAANENLFPAGKCCVTSAGNLPYRCVIHTVGPRWGDYRDKSQCLQLLQDSVNVTFEEADNQKMRSIAIPAISHGKFFVAVY